METTQRLQVTDAAEPIGLKSQAVEERYKNQDWDSDSLRVWYDNKLPSYLWTECGWGSFLTWPELLECLSAWNKDIKRWLKDELSWTDMMADIMLTIPRFKPWLDGRHGERSNRYFPLRVR